MIRKKTPFREDYVTSLLTGKFETVSTTNGNKTVFIPNKRNENRPLNELVTNGHSKQFILEREGEIALPLVMDRDPEKGYMKAFCKDKKEKEEAKKAKKAYKLLLKPDPETRKKFLFTQQEMLRAIRNHGIPNWDASSYTTVIQFK